FADIAYWVIGALIGDAIPSKDIYHICHDIFKAENFRNGSRASVEEVLPLTKVCPGLLLAELSNGPTLAFKDYGALFLARLYSYFYEKGIVTKKILVIVATSGDTGGAMINAFRGLTGVELVCLSGKGRVTTEQAAQMYTASEANIHNLTVEGDFSDCQRIAKALIIDPVLRERFQIASANSINIARIVAQVAYHAYAYVAVTDHAGQFVDSIVQAGNLGNGVSGLIAKRMGIPFRSITLVQNENDPVARFLRDGTYRPDAETHKTWSSAQDVRDPSNFERLLFTMTYGRALEVTRLMNLLATQGGFDVSETPYWVPPNSEVELSAVTCTDKDVISTARRVYRDAGLIIDPHTANVITVGLSRYDSGLLQGGVPTIAFETAQPAKFGEFVREALGIDPPVPESLRRLLNLEHRITTLPNDIEAVREYVRGIKTEA
ncbi:MAG: threonine synthase, partial [Candidatus Moranbacteria bacterium]|nr:threonine synthase [Candidatus Moranbacteria bacterium]